MRAMKRVREFLERERKKDCKTEIRHKRAKGEREVFESPEPLNRGKDISEDPPLP